MSTMSSSSNSTTNEKSKRRTWHYGEDEKLIQFLKDMCQDGKWKADGSFKSGYLLHLEKMFEKEMPEAGMKITNIDSRLCYLKKRFNALLEIKQKGSGFGWDEEQKMVTGDPKIFEEWAKSHKDARGLFRKPFPLFDDLEFIFAKDRAVGASAATAADRDDEVDMSHDSILEAIQHNVPGAEDDDEDVSISDTRSKRKKTSEASGGSSKRSRNKEVESVQTALKEAIKQISEDNKEQHKELLELLDRTHGSYKKGLYEELEAIPDLSRFDRIKLVKKMTLEDAIVVRDLKDERSKYDYLRLLLDDF